MRLWEDAWKAIFSPDWISIWWQWVRKQVHQRSHPQVQRWSRDKRLEWFIGSNPRIRETSWLSPIVHPSKSSVVQAQKEGKIRELGFQDSHMNPHLCSPKDPMREEVTPFQDSGDLPYLQHLSFFQVAYTHQQSSLSFPARKPKDFHPSSI